MYIQNLISICQVFILAWKKMVSDIAIAKATPVVWQQIWGCSVNVYIKLEVL